MKICVFADFHGDVAAVRRAADIARKEQPDKTVVCGDIFGRSDGAEIARILGDMDSVLYLIKGNNDWYSATRFLDGLEDNAVMYHFGRMLFFTHGDRYNALRIPPVLNKGDALIHGHTHMASLRRIEGLYVFNVGSLARPRDGVPSYLLLDDAGAAIKTADGEVLSRLDWD